MHARKSELEIGGQCRTHEEKAGPILLGYIHMFEVGVLSPRMSRRYANMSSRHSWVSAALPRQISRRRQVHQRQARGTDTHACTHARTHARAHTRACRPSSRSVMLHSYVILTSHQPLTTSSSGPRAGSVLGSWRPWCPPVSFCAEWGERATGLCSSAVSRGLGAGGMRPRAE